MFTIYIKEISGLFCNGMREYCHEHRRYFKNWETAKKELLFDLKLILADGGVVRYNEDEVDDNGIHHFSYVGKTCTGENFSLYLAPTKFEDE